MSELETAIKEYESGHLASMDPRELVDGLIAEIERLEAESKRVRSALTEIAAKPSSGPPANNYADLSDGDKWELAFGAGLLVAVASLKRALEADDE